MKNNRQKTILDIIRSKDVETQDDLIRELAASGYAVTQATVSRDIRELKLIKVTGDSGKYKYTVPEAKEENETGFYISAFAASIKTVECAMNTVVIKTYPGLASAVAANLDSTPDLDIVGCVAGDDTIFAVTHSLESAKQVCSHIRALTKSV